MPLDHDYPVPPSELLDVLLDLDYLKARHERFKGVGTPEVERSDAEAVITTVRQLPMDKVPGAFKGFVGDGQIVQVDTWTLPNDASADAITGAWRADLGTAPAKMGGTHHVGSTATGSQYSVTVDVSIKVPFVGGKMEGQVRGYLEHLISKEQDFLDEWLARR